jgi:hypothetical protein
MTAALRSIWGRIRRLLGRRRVVERPPATTLSPSQELSGILVGIAGEAGWPVDISQPELDLVGVLIGVEGWQRLRQFEALEKALPFMGADPEPPPDQPLDRLDLLTAIVRLGWSDPAPEAGCHAATDDP